MIIDSNDDRPRKRVGEDPIPAEAVSNSAEETVEKPKRTRARKQEATPPSAPPWKLLGWSLGGVVALLLFLWIGSRIDEFLATEPRFALAPPVEAGEPSPNLQITGMKRADRDEVLKIFAPDLGKSIYLVPLSERRERLTNIDWVRDASVLRIWPNRIQVHLTERVPVASIHLPPTPRDIELGQDFHLALIDNEGTILTPHGTSRPPAPVVTGVSPEVPIEERKIRVQRVVKLMREAGIYRERIALVDAFDPNNLKLHQPFMQRDIVLFLGHEKFFVRLENYFTNIEKLPQNPNIPGFDLQSETQIVSLSPVPKAKAATPGSSPNE